MKSLKTFTLWLAFLVSVFSQNAFSQIAAVKHQHAQPGGPLDFVENKKQWPDEVLFKTSFEGINTLFIENQGFTYLLNHAGDMDEMHRLHKAPLSEREKHRIRQHAYRVRFLGSTPSAGRGIAKRKVYHNYFLGNDKSRWSGHVGLYGKVEQKNIYPGIHVETYSQKGHLKYDLIVEPSADPSQIKMEYEGADKLELVEGNLNIHTSVGTVTELTPIAWQEIDEKRVKVPCYFSLNGNILTYSFPEGYDEKHELVIDPTIIASTLTGTPASAASYANFGHSATFDNAGNIYAAGIAFEPLFPITPGAFQTFYGGGTNDIAIIKYNPDGSDVIYATYIGGTGNDYPHSIITDFNQQLYIYGSSTSTNYPVTANGFQTNYGGNSDIIVTILNQDGSALVGSSYFGGGDNDGYNENDLLITHDYGDWYRGEVVIDGQNNVYVVSNSQSSDFPVTANAFDTQLDNTGFPAQDVVVFKANSDLSVLFWATYLGGDDLDSGNGIRVDDEYNVYVTGTAGGSNFPTTSGTFQSNWPGGEESGYLTKISNDGTTLLASTFFGTNSEDNSYFLDIDEDGQVHIFGKTQGNIPITPAGVYAGVPGSRQFLAAFSNDLTQTVYTTVIGTGYNGGLFQQYEFIPVAFMVDKCNGIYFCGYEAIPGLPTSSGSFPDLDPISNDFYLGVLTPNAEDLNYATYYGEADHVDGGTSRFDKGGVVYQGVCSCDWSGNLTTLPNAWATTNSSGCDIGVFKIDLEIEAINANGAASPSTSGCVPFDVDFTFTGTNATDFEWTIDGVVVSNLPDHSYTFNDAGTYEVELVVSNPTACNPTDTFNLEIEVLDGESTLTDTSFCTGDELYLDATTPNGTYEWQDGSTVATYTVQQPGTYWVDVSIGGCARRDSFVVESATVVSIDLGPDTSACDVNSFLLDASDPGIVSYEWQDGSQNPQFTATGDGIYTVIGIDTSGCAVTDDIELGFGQTPIVDLGADEVLCDGETLTLSPDLQNSDPLWQDGSTDAIYSIQTAGTYWLQLDNDGCVGSDSINVDFYPPISPNASANSITCANDCNGSVLVEPTGGSGMGYTFQWNTGDVTDALANLCPGPYTVTITDSNDCTAEETLIVDAPSPLEMVVTFEDVECAGDMDGLIEVSSVTGGVPPYTYAFDGGDFGQTSGMSQLSGGEYEVAVQDSLGCIISEAVAIYEPDAFVIFAGQDIRLQLGEATQFNAQIIPYTDQTINWSPPDFLDCTDCPDPTLCPTNTTLYLLTVTDPVTGCALTDSLLVTVDKERLVYVPNAFSPNEDGANDFFTLFAGAGIEEILELKVFDRWGELMFENYNFPPNDVSQGWDGTFKGETLNPAVFAYYAKVLFKDEVEILYEGGVHLMR